MFRQLATKVSPLTRTQLRSFSSSAHPIVTELKDNVLFITFNRPKSFNAMTVEMGDQFEQIMQSVSDSQTSADAAKIVKCVVFTGAGKAFSAGGDLSFLQARGKDTPANNMFEMSKFYKRFLSVRRCPVPTIAAINGPAVGAGACFTLACDLRLAASTASIGFTFAKLGLHPGMAATHFLPKIIGPQQANKMLLTGEIIKAKAAKENGMIVDIIPIEDGADEATVNEKTVAAATALANDLAANHTLANQILLRTLRGTQDAGLEAALLREAESQALCYNDADYHKCLEATVNRKKK